MVDKNLISNFKSFAKTHGVSDKAIDNFVSKVNSQYINPTILEERQLNVTQMDVFSRLFMERILFLGGEVTSDVANILVCQLLYLEMIDSSAPITMYINSPGGSVYDGLAIYDTMQYVSCPITTICTGMAASMASILLCAGAKGNRYALPHSRVMIHQPMGGVHGQASDIEITAKEILKLKDELFQIIADHSGKTLEEVRQDGDRDHWLTAQEALEYGMIDEIVVKKH
jgi:ATP-dependent Clp protease protease subunit